MADLQDVTFVLASTIAGLINSAGPTPCPVTIAPGWPTADDINTVMKSRKAHISVYPQPSISSNTTRHEWQWRALPLPAQTLIAQVAGVHVTFTGSITLPVNVAVVNLGQTYLYQPTSSDTLTTLAAGLAVLIPGASSAGPVLTIPNATAEMEINIGAQGTVLRENVRVKQGYQIIIWATSDANRSAIAESFEAALFAFNWLTLSDGTAGMLLFEKNWVEERQEVEGLYKYIILCFVEYGITETAPAWQITSIKRTIN